ncbi:hypothetical protein BGW80DRAFT_1438183 [Lactifluus volemus]|nr:hypothetical protein BGW80DRAFT_1438183 [Lactifluus volemus]
MESPTSSRSGSSSTLQRGKACLDCRRRKMKCDGIRPVCGPCSRANRPDDCEYTDGQNRTRTQMLEETITQLESRIYELEHPDSAPASVMLHDPHSTFYQTQQSFPVPGQPSLPVVQSQAEFSHGSRTSSNPEIGNINIFDSQLDLATLSPHVSRELLDAFFQYAPALHFFLHHTRFQHALSLPPGNPSRPIPALINVTYLWGILLKKDKELLRSESTLASRVATQLGNAIPATPSHQILQIIQAKILLIVYYFRIGQFLAGRHEAYSASSLAVACGLHKIRTAQPMPAFTSFVDQIDLTLPEPQDQIEEGERINAFWAVFLMDRCLAVAFGPPLVISDMDAPGMQIDTPWPLEMETYERGQILPNLRTSGTVRSFFSGMNNGWPWENHNPLTQLSKAAALFERAARLAATWRPGAVFMSLSLVLPTDSSKLEEILNVGTFYSDFVAIDQRIDEFKSQLTPVDRVPSHNVSLVHLAYCLSNGATIQLHATFSSQNTASRAKCLSAAMAMVRANQAAHAQDSVYTNAILGFLWSAGCRVIINEIVALRSFHAEPAPSPQHRDAELRSALEQMQCVMAAHASNCALMNFHLGRLQQERAGI